MESHILNQVQQTSSRVKNVLEDSERLLAELKSRRIAKPPINEVAVESEEVDYDEGYADDEAEPEPEAEAGSESEPEPESESVAQSDDEDQEGNEEHYTFFCCRTRRGVGNLLL